MESTALSASSCHASLPPHFWVEALHAAVYLHNILPSALLNFRSPTAILLLKNPSYNHLRVFGCVCYPNQSAKRDHKIQPRSTRCVFLGYPVNYRGYRCLDLITGKIILSRHVTFDETTFPFSSSTPLPPSTYSFLDDPSSSLFHDTIAYPTPSSTEPQPSPPHSPVTPHTPQPSPHSTTGPTPQPFPTQSPLHDSPSPISTSSQPRTTAVPATLPTHTMTTRSRLGTFKPVDRLNLHTTQTKPISPLPKSHLFALRDPN